MAEVYRARDTRLEREVALKVLPLELAGDPERLLRFEREAKTLASLNHPNVAQVFGIDRVDDTWFISMELVPGEDLAARLSRGALSVEEAVDLCRQIAEGVEAAHEAGVIHRDLKPANVVVSAEGRVKVLDFGLAKPAGEGGPAGSTERTVLTTAEGRLLGTPTYMAPEQARGKPIDRRVDVWAFGCVLFECLSGRRAFDGETIGDVLAAVLERDPDWSALPATTPGRLRELTRRCLRKDPRRRLRDVGEARIALEDLASGRDPATPSAAPPDGRRRVVLAGVVALLGAVVGYWAGQGRRPVPSMVRRASVPITASNSYRTNPSWSPEGEWIALGRMEEGSEDLYLRHVSSGEETLRRSGPGDDTAPCWSPDGRYIAFVASDQPGTPVLIAPPYSSGGERTLTETNIRVFDSNSYSSALGDRAWSPDVRSLLVSRVGESGQIAIWRIGLDDGRQEQLTFPPAGYDDLGASHSFAGDRIVFVRRGTRSSKLMLLPASGGEPLELLADGTMVYEPAWRPDGEHIVYEHDGNLWQVALSDPVPEQLTFLVGLRAEGPSVSATDRITYAATTHDTILTTRNLETGRTEALTSHSYSNFGPRVSPDGRSIAYQSDRTGDDEIWVHDLGGVEHRITRSVGADVYPDWSPDGRRLVFVSDRSGSPELWVADRDGGNAHRLGDQEGIATDAGAGRDSMSVRWSPASTEEGLIGFIVVSERGRTLWGISPEGGAARKLLDGVAGFDWYRDSQHVVCTLDRGRAEELVVVDLRSGDSKMLWSGPHAEIDVAPDGSAVMFCRGLGHLNMGLATLALVPPEDPEGLPSARGEPVDIVRPEGRWHVHHGGWAPDAKSVVYVHDADRANLWELVEPP